MKKYLVGALALCGLLLLAGCGGASTPPPPLTLAITSAAPPSGTTGSGYAGNGFALTASGGQAPYNWSVSALPPGLTLSNGMIAGTPTTPGTYNVVIKVADSQSPPAQKSTSYTIDVTAGSLVITSGPPSSGTVGASYASGGFSLTASGGATPYTWTWAAASGSALPPGLTLTDGVIFGTPTASGTYNVVITVADSQTPPAHTSKPYAITIAVNTGILSIDGPLPSGVAGSTYAPQLCQLHGVYTRCFGRALSATGGASPYSFSWAAAPGSSLPPGLVLQDGTTLCPFGTRWEPFLFQICGTPTTAGTYNVVVTVKDSAANQASATFPIDIENPPPPTINVNPSPALGAINLPYSFGFTTTGGLKPLSWSETGALPPGLSLTSDGTLSGTPTTVGSFPITAMAADSLGRNASPQTFTITIADHGFEATGTMGTNREMHTATLLADGRVLIAGGLTVDVWNSYYAPVSKGELYDPAAGTFSPPHSMIHSRYCHTATLLTSGKILITGGYDTSVRTPPGNLPIATAEIFDPANGAFSVTGSMVSSHACHTATLLTSGKVLIAGGSAAGFGDSNTAELYDPATGTFSTTGPMAVARQGHTATLLPSGKVLVTGGPDNTAELYDPVTGMFSSTGSMAIARTSHAATLLADGKVLVTGGADNSAEIYDPASGTFSSTGSMSVARSSHTATLLNDGTVLVAGGYSSSAPHPTTVERSAELYDPVAGAFRATGGPVIARASHTATLLNNGLVLLTGGTDDGTGTDLNVLLTFGILGSAELYQ